MPDEVFLSYSTQNEAFVTRLAQVLRQHEVTPWYSDAGIRGAQLWHDEIGQALRRCDWFVVVLSPDAVRSRWVKRELMYALQEERYEGQIVPLLHEPCDYDELSWTLNSIQRVDFTADFDTGCLELLDIWKIKYQEAAQPG